MRNLWPLMIAGSVGAMGVQAAPVDRYELRVGSYTAGQSHPREFSLDPSGKFVLIANQKSNQIVVVERDDKTGLLGKIVQKLPMDAPGDLKFLVRQ